MDYLTDDALCYLIEIILDNYGCFTLSSFYVSHRIKLLTDFVINQKIHKNYKIIIRNNKLKTPLLSYNNIYIIYGDKFVVDKDELTDLLHLIVKSNNVELIKILNKTIPKNVSISKVKWSHDRRIDLTTAINSMLAVKS